ALGFTGADAEAFVGRALLFVAIFTVAQLLAGHRLPAFEGPASVILAAILLALDHAHPNDPVRAVAGGLVLSGVVLAVIGVTGLARAVARVYTQFVTAIFLLLLAAAIAWALLPDAVGAGGPGGPAWPGWPGARPVAFVLVVGISLSLDLWAAGVWRTLSILLGFLAGLAVFLAAGSLGSAPSGGSMLGLAIVRPAFDPAVALPVAIGGLLAGLNGLATLNAVSAATGTKVSGRRLAPAFVVTGLSHAVQGVVPGVGSVPRADSAALAARDPVLARPSLALACVALAAVALTPAAVRFVLRLPEALAADVLLAVMASLTVLALRILRRTRWNRARAAVFALSLVAGGLLVPGPPDWLPRGLQYVAASPVGIGLLVALVGEALLLRREGQSRGRSEATASTR
nr:purine/pyrimidine permease [Actinomycetota bacterium]